MADDRSVFARIVDVVEYLVLAGVLVTVVALFANEPGGAPTAGSDDPALATGGEVFAARCASCHGADGGGGVGPQLGDGAVVAAYPDLADEIAVITDGRGAMPAFGGTLDADEIEAVARYTRESL